MVILERKGWVNTYLHLKVNSRLVFSGFDFSSSIILNPYSSWEVFERVGQTAKQLRQNRSKSSDERFCQLSS